MATMTSPAPQKPEKPTGCRTASWLGSLEVLGAALLQIICLHFCAEKEEEEKEKEEEETVEKEIVTVKCSWHKFVYDETIVCCDKVKEGKGKSEHCFFYQECFGVEDGDEENCSCKQLCPCKQARGQSLCMGVLCGLMDVVIRLILLCYYAQKCTFLDGFDFVSGFLASFFLYTRRTHFWCAWMANPINCVLFLVKLLVGAFLNKPITVDYSFWMTLLSHHASCFSACETFILKATSEKKKATKAPSENTQWRLIVSVVMTFLVVGVVVPLALC